MKKRLDVLLVERRLADSREKAKAIIMTGNVFVNGEREDKAGTTFDEEKAQIEIKGHTMKYVSRGGYKLEAALDYFSLSVDRITAVDIGASSGGFTDCLLKRGAKKVYAVDCGVGQLVPSLRRDSRVVSLENTNARSLNEELLGEKVDLAVMDLSFISQTLVYPALCRVLNSGGVFVSLIKPQFEAGREAVGKNGIVKDEKARRAAVEKVLSHAHTFGLVSRGVIESPIKGGDGNVEFLTVFDYLPNRSDS